MCMTEVTDNFILVELFLLKNVSQASLRLVYALSSVAGWQPAGDHDTLCPPAHQGW